MDQVKIGKFLAMLRKKENLTQEELGEKIGVTNKTISRWENGTYMPDIEMFLILSKLYKVSLNELFCGEYLSKEEYTEKSEENIVSIAVQNNKLVRKVTLMILILVCMCLCFLSIVSGIFIYERYNMLYPDKYNEFEISEKIVLNELVIPNNDKGDHLIKTEELSIYLSAPGYSHNSNLNILTKGNSFISIRSYYTYEYFLPTTTGLNIYFNEMGIYRYTDKCLFAINYNLDKVSIFSSETEIDIAAGCRMILSSINFPNTDKNDIGHIHKLTGKWNGYIVSSGNPNKDDNVWSIVIEHKERLLFIVVKDTEIGTDKSKLMEWISRIDFE